MTIHSSTFDFWREDGIRYIIPGGKTLFPEGWDLRPFLVLLAKGLKTVEFGSGIGRLAGLFPVEQYLGIDINPKAVEVSRRNQPEHRFEVLDYNNPLPDAPFYFAYTVFLHIDDETLPKILQVIPKSCKRFCIAEVMGREWRLDGQKDPPVFNRDAKEYVLLMHQAGFKIVEAYDMPYLHYFKMFYGKPNEDSVNTNVDFLVFERV